METARLEITLVPIGFVRCTRSEPRDDGWDAEESWVELAPDFPEESLRGLGDFSHVEILYIFDRVAPERVERGARHPRGNPAWPQVGIFAQRGKDRPNHLGATVCQVRGVEGRTLRVMGLDAIEGTPVVDIKPWMAEFGPRGPVHQPRWASELMEGYWSKPST